MPLVYFLLRRFNISTTTLVKKMCFKMFEKYRWCLIKPWMKLACSRQLPPLHSPFSIESSSHPLGVWLSVSSDQAGIVASCFDWLSHWGSVGSSRSRVCLQWNRWLRLCWFGFITSSCGESPLCRLLFSNFYFIEKFFKRIFLKKFSNSWMEKRDN